MDTSAHLKYNTDCGLYFSGEVVVLQRIIGVTELQRHFRAVLDEVVSGRVPCILTRGSRPEAVLIPYEDFVRFQELRENETLARFDRLRARLAAQNARYSEDEVAADVEAARTERPA
ncbi:MAG: type II toxin-antitoxin system Phd/YefM family antitoxin [Chloroflexi bacterium]|nr:type II toxin-antitoxin system Phd/YefM family antitoxin [Chloroflexota bacterium]